MVDEVKAAKFVNSLPATLELDTIYFVKSGAGFDLYVTNHTGTPVAYPLNVGGASPIPNIYYAEQAAKVVGSALVSTTAMTNGTNGTPVIELNLQHDLPAGDYLLEWGYKWNHDSQQNDFVAGMFIDGSSNAVNDLHRQEPKDSAGTGGSTGTDQKYSFSDTSMLNFPIDQTTPTFAIRFGTSAAGDESGIWAAWISLKRVNINSTLPQI